METIPSHELARKALTDAIADAGIVMTSTHVPTPYDPASKEWQCITWRATFTSPRGTFSTDYRQGLGHLPKQYEKYKATYDKNRLIEASLKTGMVCQLMETLGYVHPTKKPLTPPDVADVVGSLLLDAGAIDCADYEGWAREFGYEPDSRKGEAIFKAFRENGLSALRVFGGAAMEKMRPLANEL